MPFIGHRLLQLLFEERHRPLPGIIAGLGVGPVGMAGAGFLALHLGGRAAVEAVIGARINREFAALARLFQRYAASMVFPTRSMVS